MNKKEYFLEIMKRAEKTFGKDMYRLAADGWNHGWQTLIATIMSAQSKDETTIPIAEDLFKKYPTLKKLASAKYADVLKVFKSLNYNKTKAKHVIEAAEYLIKNYDSKVPEDMDKLLAIPGVGRKTANLVITEVHNLHGICVDTHVHRISNVFGFVKTNTPDQTEEALKKIAPKKLWYRINRLFVLWGKQVPGKDKERLLEALK